MSEITRKAQFTRFNKVDFAIVVIAICTPYLFDGLQIVFSGFMPTFELGIVPKNVITISVLFFRIAIAKGQNPYSDNSISMIVLVIWSILWLLSWNGLDAIITMFLLKSVWLQVIYWLLFIAIIYFFLFELTFRKKKIVEAKMKMNILEKKIIDNKDKEVGQQISDMKKKIEELEEDLKGNS